ncbi:MAG: ABC transporter ATP-binding protein [Alphaproteobacteria bacterium]|nr:ABC transporter ATP-binding protein [Alphaproteobacteria bacterium]MCB9928778.1 ABC transporter ATP-binding protein [Alphaproteobacteria bacterium]
MPTDPPFLAVEQASYAYPGEGPTVDRADLALAPGDFHCLVGRSGCGKTTLLKLAAGLVLPTAGRVRIAGRALTGPSRDVGFAFQSPSLLEWRTVLDNVLLPISLHRRVRPADRAAALDWLDRLGIAEHGPRYPRQLSGGQQSRAALARALVTAPPALLMDEPFAALDAITREELQDDLLRLTRERGTTVLFVTHDMAEAVYLGTHVSVMARGRIGRTFAVDLPARHGAESRYDPRFTALCHDIRAALAPPAEAAA